MTLRIGVVTFPGTLDDRDAARAVRIAGGEAVELWHGDADIKGVEVGVRSEPISEEDWDGDASRFSPEEYRHSTLIDTGTGGDNNRDADRITNIIKQTGVEQQLEHVIVSHYHGDHVGNVDMFPASTLLIQKAELDWAFAEAKASLAKAA